MFRLDASAIEGRPRSAFAGEPAAGDDTSWISETLRREGSITSIAEIRRGDGTKAWIEFHLQPAGDPRLFVAFCREPAPRE